MARLPEQARISFDPAGYPVDDQHADGFFSRHNGLEETRAVFLDGCGLPAGWAGRTNFTIGELGFGTGLNLAATLDLWRQSGPPDGWLTFISYERYPMAQADAARALAAWPELAAITGLLLERWPVRASGHQTIDFPQFRAALQLVTGDACVTLPASRVEADAWFLDGFAPSRNPDMWSADLLAAVAAHTAPGGRLATYSSARVVRDGLEAAGLIVERVQGFGGKKHRLTARKPGLPSLKPAHDPVLVIGGGIGGAVTANLFHRLGHAVTVLDPDPCGTTKASNNPAALVMPRLDRGDTPQARFHLAAWLLAVRELTRSGPDCFAPVAVTEQARHDRDGARIEGLLADPALPDDWLGAGAGGSLVHRTGGVVWPHALRRHLLQAIPVIPAHAARLERVGGVWCACADDGTTMAEAPLSVVAAGPAVGQLLAGLDLSLEGRAGQVSLCDWTRPDGVTLPLAGGAYALAFEQWLLHGATFDPWPLDAPPPPVTGEAHDRNFAALAALDPALARACHPGSAWGRASVRVTASDRMPLAGPTTLADGSPGPLVVGALGSRGFTTAWLCARIVAACATGSPLPVDCATADAVSPMRFAARTARKSNVRSKGNALIG